jgi:hypothetical protein
MHPDQTSYLTAAISPGRANVDYRPFLACPFPRTFQGRHAAAPRTAKEIRRLLVGWIDSTDLYQTGSDAIASAGNSAKPMFFGIQSLGEPGPKRSARVRREAGRPAVAGLPVLLLVTGLISRFGGVTARSQTGEFADSRLREAALGGEDVHAELVERDQQRLLPRFDGRCDRGQISRTERAEDDIRRSDATDELPGLTPAKAGLSATEGSSRPEHVRAAATPGRADDRHKPGWSQRLPSRS